VNPAWQLIGEHGTCGIVINRPYRAKEAEG